MTLFFSIIVCHAQQKTTIEKEASVLTSVTSTSLRVIFDDDNGRLVIVDNTSATGINRIISFRLSVRIQGISYSEKTRGSFLNKKMRRLLKKTDANSIVYFEEINIKDATHHTFQAASFQYNVGRAYIPKKE